MSAELDDNSELQKWQYCILNILVARNSGETAERFQLDITETKKEEIKDRNPLEVIAEMGEDGWEMVNGNNNLSTFVFKRPKR